MSGGITMVRVALLRLVAARCTELAQQLERQAVDKTTWDRLIRGLRPDLQRLDSAE